MKLTTADNLKLRTALAACKQAGINLAVIWEGKIRALSESRTAAIISELQLSIDPNIQIGITRLSELVARVSLFGDDIVIEGEETADQKVRKLIIRGKAGKIDFRCTDVAILDKQKLFPKSAFGDDPAKVITLSKPEISLLSKGIKTLGAEMLTIQVKRDGTVHFESLDSSSDRFEMDLAAPAEFIDESYPSVTSYLTSSNGVLLTLLEHAVKEADSTQIVMMKSGNISLKVLGHDIFAIPRIQT